MSAFQLDEENPRETDSQSYINTHCVMDLLDNMTSMLIYARPDEPKAYLSQQLEKLKVARQSGMYYPCLFDDSNLISIFAMMDPTRRGFITRDQYIEALHTLGVKENYEEYPTGSEVNRINMDTFLKEAKGGLSKASATFHQ